VGSFLQNFPIGYCYHSSFPFCFFNWLCSQPSHSSTSHTLTNCSSSEELRVKLWLTLHNHICSNTFCLSVQSSAQKDSTKTKQAANRSHIKCQQTVNFQAWILEFPPLLSIHFSSRANNVHQFCHPKSRLEQQENSTFVFFTLWFPTACNPSQTLNSLTLNSPKYQWNAYWITLHPLLVSCQKLLGLCEVQLSG
jgi:hypothetical protein